MEGSLIYALHEFLYRLCDVKNTQPLKLCYTVAIKSTHHSISNFDEVKFMIVLFIPF